MKSFPFDSKVTFDSEGSPIYDRPADSSMMRGLFNQFFSTGLTLDKADNFKVSAGTGMTVLVNLGSAVINGVSAIEESTRTLEIQASESQDRIDSVVLRLDDSIDTRAVDLYVVKGTANGSPTAPDLTRNTSVYEIGLANIFIPSNSTAITDERITDTRNDDERCGFSNVNAENVSFDTINNEIDQLQSDVENLSADYVVEQGTSGLWNYRKWNSGVAECWGYSKTETVTTSALMGGYYCGVDVSLPSGLFNAPPLVDSVMGTIGAGFGVGTGSASTSSSIAVFLWGNQGSTSATIRCIHCTGTWK